MSSLSIDSNQLALNAFSLGATQPVSSIQSLLDNLGTTQGTTSASDMSSTGPAASTHISKQSQLLSKLQQLQQQDPAKYTQVVTDIANKLQAAAQSATGDQKTFLTNLAAKFQNAENGDLSGFQPPAQSANGTAALYQTAAAQTAQGSTPTSTTQGSTHGHHHHHHEGSQSGGQQALSGIFAELNSALGITTPSTSSASASTSSQLTTQATGSIDQDNDGDSR
jgi:hypothetical protein